MANKGETRQQKTLSAEKIMGFERKKAIWRIAYRCGAHKKKEGLPLGYVIRDLLGLAETADETRKILSRGMIRVNGKVIKRAKYNVGLFDLIDLDATKKRYLIGFDRKGRAKLFEETYEKDTAKLSKILRKTLGKKGKWSLGTDDGRTIMTDNKEIQVGDTVVLGLPKQEIREVIKMKEGNTVYLIGGKHVGRVAKIKRIGKGTMMRKPLVTLEQEDEEFRTRKDYCFVVGEKTSKIKVSQ